ncbi:MAG: ABC transporter ATP-binding protein [Chitinophagales bacterium]|jgi:ABC-2 type transport system ATP-binding protein|nr:ABC transporter ATP-binding protein [Saprospirales bacterium]MBP6659558.1 ABC transporter ATP-binding protein [Chitinophagales bacterium]
MILVENLNYEYPEKRALTDVSFEIEDGAITALVGPNGAGKTTLLRSIAALSKPISGNVMINGFNASTQPREVHAQVGYLQDLFGLYDDLTVLQSVQFMAHSRLHTDSDFDAAVDLAIHRAGAFDFADKKVGTLSRGMRQRVGIAQAIIHEPKVLLLDEPASGLDPEARYALSALLLELQQIGMTIIVSSHILAELEDYSSEMLVIQDGRMIEHRSLSKDKAVSNLLALEIGFTKLEESHFNTIAQIEGVSDISFSGNKIQLKLDTEKLTKQTLLKQLIANDMPVDDITETKVNLQDEYIKTVENYKNNKA